MRTKRLRLSAAVFLCSCLLSCNLQFGIFDPADETFEAEDRPTFDLVTLEGGYTCKLLKPWNYDKPWNRWRRYPLVVSLHGSGGSYYAPCIVGDDGEMQNYPCFFLAPHSASGWGSPAAWVTDEIEALARNYRVDDDRVYLMGFSMGGSGSYDFLNLAYNRHGRLFAGLVRLAGSYVSVLADEIMDSTSIWYHVGTADSYDEGGENSGTAYANIRDYARNRRAAETVETDTVGGFERVTKTLTLRGVRILRMSRYSGMGHSGSVPFQDPGVLAWLFSQSLENR